MSKHNKKHQAEFEKLAEEQLAQEQAQEAYPEDEPTPAAKTEEPDYREQYVRLYAEFDNYRKRTEREKAALIAYGKKDFALKMLPMYEVLLRQQKNLQEKKEQDLKSLQDGMRMILTELDKAFGAEGIQKMNVLKKPYDPATQEVVAMIPAPKEDDGLVIDEVKMGFMMQGQVLRPASVVVGQAKEDK
ncbi:MAG: nucleotide exchange factor GrpE [Elusimicrobiaceae bacterium]|nr:nucleotide exchange factor GrpE [Elusimicrobiaceae bacterium]MBP5617242.1 nucleotide exchange factor GrpE [Elusimicrobiaceae bacterium]